MIKKMFDDGCLGVKLYAQEAHQDQFKKYLRSISPLSGEENEILAMQIIAREEDVRVFPQSGYRVGWKRTPNFSFLVVVFCPIQEIQESGSSSEVTTGGYL